MSTTIDISATPLDQARKLAAREDTTVKALVEPGLRSVVATRRQTGAFRLREASFGGEGLQAEVSGAT